MLALLKNTLAQMLLKMKTPGANNRFFYNGKRHARLFSADVVERYLCGRGPGFQISPKGNPYQKIVSRAPEEDRRLQNLLLAWNREGPTPVQPSHAVWKKLQYFESTLCYFTVAFVLA